VGADSVPPGGTAQYSAVAHQSDGSTRDVTSEAVWRTWNASVLTVSSTGLATGHARGATNIETSAGGRSSNKEIIVVPTGTYRLSGVVREEGLPMAGVRVEVVAGAGQGFVAVTNVFGEYVFWGVAAAIEVRVTRDGYQEQRKSLQITSHQTLDFDLIPSRPRAEVAGTYTLTVTAAAGCRAMLPEGARIRTYTAAVRQDGPRLTVTLEGPRFYSQGTRLLNSFRGTEVTGGPAAGLVTTSNNFDGSYRLYGVSGDTSVLATKEGYQSQEQRVVVTDHQTLNLDLMVTRVDDVSGAYSMTITASELCRAALPQDARMRTYTVVLTQRGRDVEATLGGAKFVVDAEGRGNRFRGRLEPESLRFELQPMDFYYYYYAGSRHPDVIEGHAGGYLVLVGPMRLSVAVRADGRFDAALRAARARRRRLRSGLVGGAADAARAHQSFHGPFSSGARCPRQRRSPSGP